ncbi:WD40-repeat-containing domain protein [Cladochytrium replicatum]|nr:WD40-repeat-containing domain protein [Cladochytrium replicatum]
MAYLQDPSLERTFRGHKDAVTALSFKPSMTQIASSSLDHAVMCWNFKPQVRAYRFIGHTGPVTSVDFAPSGTLLASSSRDKTVRLWTPNVKGDVTVFKAHTSSVRTVQFSSDGEMLLTSSDDKSVKIWSTNRTKFMYTLAGHLNWVRTARFSPDSRLVVSGSDDKTVKLWDLASKTCVKTYWDHVGMITGTAIHPSGTIIASCSTDRTIKLFDIRTHKLIQHYGDAHVPIPASATFAISNTAPSRPSSGAAMGQASGGVNSISFGGKNGEWLISTGVDGLAKIWDLKEGTLFYTLHGHKLGPTTAAVFAPDGDTFATAGTDAMVMVWKSNFDEKMPGLGEKRKSNGGGLASTTPTQEDKRPATMEEGRQRTPIGSSTGPASKSGSQQKSVGKKPLPGSPQLGSSKRAVDPEIVEIGAPLFQKVDDTSGRKASRRDDATFSDAQRAEIEASEGGNQSQPYTSQLHVRTVPNELASTLEKVVRQVDMMTQTMNILETRLTMTENRVEEMGKTINEAITRMEKVIGKAPASLFESVPVR